jgi:hypothetical protein
MLRMRNKYCSNCLKTQRFLDLGSYLVCIVCSKRLERLSLVVKSPTLESTPIHTGTQWSPKSASAAESDSQATPIAGLVVRPDDNSPSNPSAI